MLRNAAARLIAANVRVAPRTSTFIRPLSTSAPRLFASPTDTSQKYNITLPESSFDSFKCDLPSVDVEVSKDQLLDMYTKLVSMRRMEMSADGLYKAKQIRGFCHLCTGQEAVSVGMEAAITPDDHIITAYRCHGFTYIRGGSIKSIVAELLGRKDGISEGKGGSMHMFAKNFYGGNGIVGAQVPVGAGIAFAQKYLGNNNITFALYGDGAANQGQVFEAYNMAKLWDLPVAFVCENNRYGMGTSAARSSASTKYFTRGDYIPGIQVNGMDVLAVRQACSYAKEWTSAGKGPIVIEMVTYRYGGHSMSDPGTTYRTREEIQHMRSTSDAITGLKQRILDLGVATEAEIKTIDKEARQVVDEAVEEAKASPLPDESTLYKDIYVKGSEPQFLRGREPDEVHYFH
ncbi:dehydrogenase E1 component-domain-containing protein [Jimgerdemannia flammicorona]|uniref:Pyruvate dehydrogenase E1 component subunit alpha n=2 Tax=Jimgerdemannia flammicorona TaxID=994334 RepID=A0A433QMV7_9FUNG|nr:dehydrogenase E1 component-domain-containing protein [Jimgerdemannia flammicorona]